jgi:hypothetical protein
MTVGYRFHLVSLFVVPKKNTRARTQHRWSARSHRYALRSAVKKDPKTVFQDTDPVFSGLRNPEDNSGYPLLSVQHPKGKRSIIGLWIAP